MSLVALIGIANPIPSTDVPDSFKVFTPITCPLLLTKAPPLFPELIAASVWIATYLLPSSSDTSRFTALIIPAVTLLSKPSGLPIAIENSPTWTLSESPSSAAVKSVLSILITAKSVWESVPIISPLYSVSSLYSLTVTLLAFPIS